MIAVFSLVLLAAATRRLLSLPSAAGGFDAGFARHPVLTAAHITPGVLFVLLGPWQFLSSVRRRHPWLHRWMGRAFFADSIVVGLTALVMSPQMAIGGPLETAATLVFAALFLFAVCRSFAAIRARRIPEHRRWAIRAYAIGIGAGAVRPVVGIFFATSRFSHLGPHEFFGLAFWIGFTLSLAAAELWIRSDTDRRIDARDRRLAATEVPARQA
jgi:uncharacterized membrane protein YsdA (DUF1294 family)